MFKQSQTQEHKATHASLKMAPNNFFLMSVGSKPPEEYTIPKGTITRIMRQVLPKDSRVTSGAKETMDQYIVQFCAALTRVVVCRSAIEAGT
jgi:histidinol-phosphate/aromatic aminotransferase/cobyric acid decarboxylase-like protein